MFQSILVGDSEVVLTGGTDNMSQAPFSVRNIRFGTSLGTKIEFEDTLWTGLTDTHCGLPMALTAEKLGEQFSVTREECDKFAYRSQQQWKKGKRMITEPFFHHSIFCLKGIRKKVSFYLQK